MGETFRPPERIKRRPEFQHVFDCGTRLNGRFMTVFVLPNELPHQRLGIVATRKIGGAVERNRAKRVIRDIFRRNKTSQGLDVVVLARRELPGATLAAVEADYRSILKRRRPRS